jgi:hypothetical protein
MESCHESCHECAELVNKLNKEFETLLNEKDLYKSKLKEKNDLVIEMIKNEYLKLNEIRGKKDRLNRVDDNIVKEYNTLSFQENNIQKFIIELCGCI